MRRLLRDIGFILALASLWAVSGYVIGVTIELIAQPLGINIYPLGITLASINIIIGMLLFKGITRDPTAERIFFEGPGEEGEGDIRIGCLWVIPLTLLLYGLLLGIMAVLFRFFLPK